MPRRILVRLLLLLLVVAAAPFLYRGCVQEDAHVRFVVHASLRDGDDVYSGSGVWEAHLAQARILSHSMFKSVRGEAVQLHGAGGKNLFLLRTHYGGGSGLTYGAFPLQCPTDVHTNVDWIRELRGGFPGRCFVTKQLPMVVEIPDLNDPSSIQRVLYNFPVDGACADPCLTELWIEHTDKPITTGLERTLPWLAEHDDQTANVVTGVPLVNVKDPLGQFLLNQFTTE